MPRQGPALNLPGRTEVQINTTINVIYYLRSIVRCGVGYSFLHVLFFVCVVSAEFSLRLGQVADSRSIKCGGTAKHSDIVQIYLWFIQRLCEEDDELVRTYQETVVPN